MKEKRRVLFVFGTRPEVIKLAPVIRSFEQSEHFRPFLLNTAQHREMADEMLSIFDLKPDFDLNIMTPNQDFFTLASRLMESLGKTFTKDRFDLVVTQGDTTTAFLGSLAAFYSRIPVAHVEAGLRTLDKYSPYPEEMNRRLVSSLADLHFPPTNGAGENLTKEGVSREKIHVTGNTVIDALLWALGIPHTPGHDLKSFLDEKGRIILVTTHRRENFGEPHRQVFSALKRIVETFSDVRILFPVHPNPKVREEVGKTLGNHPRIHLCAPLGYLDFLQAMNRSTLILTDSGGVQEEAPTLKKPVLILREQTERPEGVESGVLKLVGTDPELIFSETRNLLQNPSVYQKMTEKPNPYGDGKASERILTAVRGFFGLLP